MKKQNLGGILSLKKNVVSKLNSGQAGDAMGGNSNLTVVTLCVSCTEGACCPGGWPVTRNPNDSYCYCE